MGHRTPAENEQRIVEALRAVTTQGGHGNYLIISVAHAYVQFLGEQGSDLLLCEAASNDALPPERKLSSDKIEALRQLGFQPPRLLGLFPRKGNYSQFYEVPTEELLRDLAAHILTAFDEVYDVPPDSDFELQIHLA